MMNESLRIFQDITSPNFKMRNRPDRVRIFNDFANCFGWHPSDYLEPEYGISQNTNGHLLVEHGLEHTAVITFMTQPLTNYTAPFYETKAMLEISYNNLVDWHLTVHQSQVCKYFNRTDPPWCDSKSLIPTNLNELSASRFHSTIEGHPLSNFPALDTVLVNTVDYWKKFLYDEITCQKKNEALSALFNAIMFVRAVEDHYLLTHKQQPVTLIERWRRSASNQQSLRKELLNSLRSYRAGRGASELLNLNLLEPFERLETSTIENLIKDFYNIKDTPYKYNFALMSRHALSRIYEKYVSLLRQDEVLRRTQKTLFPVNLPEAEFNKAAGTIYTPQFIPRFFCRFIEDRLSPRAFRNLKIADPACGSGIFLRAFLERKIAREDLSTKDIEDCFNGILGLDIDENACQASKLSLALLHLMRTHKLPSASKLKIIAEEAIGFHQAHTETHQAFGAVVCNPPFVRLELQNSALQDHIRNFLSDIVQGRPDLYLAFLRLAMKTIRPKGFLAFVLPQSFFIGESPKGLRKELREQFWIRCIIDLSAIQVFDVSSYVVLLIAQKKPSDIKTAPACRVGLCQDFVGNALQDCLDNKTVRNPYYSVFDVDQEYFGDDPWILLGPEEVRLERKLQAMRKVGDFLIAHEGLITGHDSVYIMPTDKVPSQEHELYAPFLPDRQIEQYTVPRKPTKYVYYPYREGKRIPKKELQRAQGTWAYLTKHHPHLNKSAATTWPYLVRPRAKELLLPKIISPYLILSPRFALDIRGKYAISRGPFLIPSAKDSDLELLMFFTAVLNSSVVHWYLGIHAHRFSRGYVVLDLAYVRKIPVPDPSRISPSHFNEIVRLVEKRIKTRNMSLDAKINKCVLNLYNLTSADLKLMGIEED